MSITLRAGTPEDARPCGSIVYEAYKAISDHHNFPQDFPSAEVAQQFLSGLLSDKQHVESIIAEVDGRIAGSIFLTKKSVIAGVGPNTVDVSLQNSSIGRRMMEALLEQAGKQDLAGIRLLQGAWHSRSLALYIKNGFVARELLSCLQGSPLKSHIPGHATRVATEGDLPACNALHLRIHGFMREYELREAIRQNTAMVVERQGRITGYTTSVSFFGYTVGEANDDIKALIAAAPAFAGPGFFVPARNNELLLWCLASGLRIVQPMTLMSIGLYNEPAGPWLPSIYF